MIKIERRERPEVRSIKLLSPEHTDTQHLVLYPASYTNPGLLMVRIEQKPGAAGPVPHFAFISKADLEEALEVLNEEA